MKFPLSIVRDRVGVRLASSRRSYGSGPFGYVTDWAIGYLDQFDWVMRPKIWANWKEIERRVPNLKAAIETYQCLWFLL